MANRVVLQDRIADYSMRRLNRIKELSGMSRGQILDDIIWLASIITEYPEYWKGGHVDISLQLRMERILEAIEKKKGEANEQAK